MAKKKMGLADLAAFTPQELKSADSQNIEVIQWPQLGDAGWVVREDRPTLIKSAPCGPGKRQCQYRINYKVQNAGELKSNGYDNKLNRSYYWSRLGSFGDYISQHRTESEAMLSIKTLPTTREEIVDSPTSTSGYRSDSWFQSEGLF